ncbi:hypothetical protein RHSIM_Rhsim11G0079700 [Rhododendron simsii]|uniref:Cellulose synthase n=1 Tax=Rhododendron simsii TaxID=118357 RepID=A0A834LAU5_RHOSS|nr:hypothetical protein RHSIM_Rhsim11G0079700 [Rhododendron simsii]
MDAKKDLEHYMGMVQLRGKTEWKRGRKGRMEVVLVSHRSTCRGQSAQNPGIPFPDYDQEREYKEFKVRINGLVGMAHKVFLDGAHDVEGNQLPHLIYVSREKRPEFYHHKKAGAINALLRASAVILIAAYLLTVDCDNYINNSKALREAMCFMMDPASGKKICYVQFPQRFDGIDRCG